ncbi:MAG TPA: dynamin family protein [Ktedonobacterales bacterium]|nr:dynamin family protein [Ktedonobacterales bacterium]
MEFHERLAPLEPFFALSIGQAPAPLKATLQPLLTMREVLWRKEAQITFFGGFKAGKSTLLNAIMGWSLLPARANRATGVITKVQYAAQASASVARRAPDGKAREEPILLDEIGRYVFLDLSEMVARAPADVDAVTIHLPLALLKHGCILADTPGLMDNQTLTERCYRELERSDLAVMVLSAVKLLADEERAAAERAQELLQGNLVFIVNRLDMIDAEDKDDLLAWARSSLEGHGNSLVGQPAVFATEAKGALEARKTGQQDEAVAGLQAFEHWLEALLDSPALEQMAMRSRLSALTYLLGQARQKLQAGLAETQQTASELEKQETASAAQRERQFKREVDEALLGLSSFKSNLGQLGDHFIYHCVQSVQDLIDCDERWASQEKLRVCFESAIAVYASTVNHRTREELRGLSVPVVIFEPGARRAIDVGTIRDPSAKLAVGAGMVLNTVLETGLVGSSFVNWITKSLLTDDARQKLLGTVRQAALEILPALRSEAESYLEQMEALVRRFGRAHQPDTEPSASLWAARQIEEYYRGLVTWANDFQQALDTVKQTLAF